jgi:hypothetical protein
MLVHELISFLKMQDPNLDVIIVTSELGMDHETEIAQVYKFVSVNYVCLRPGKSYEEHD